MKNYILLSQKRWQHCLPSGYRQGRVPLELDNTTQGGANLLKFLILAVAHIVVWSAVAIFAGPVAALIGAAIFLLWPMLRRVLC